MDWSTSALTIGENASATRTSIPSTPAGQAHSPNRSLPQQRQHLHQLNANSTAAAPHSSPSAPGVGTTASVHSNSSTATRLLTRDGNHRTSQRHPIGIAASSHQQLPATEPTSRSSISTVDSEGRVGASSLRRMSKRWTTLETAGRFMFALSVAFLVIGVILTAVGFAAGVTSRRDGCDVGFAAGVTSRRDGCDVGFAAGVTSRRDGCDVGFAAGVTSRRDGCDVGFAAGVTSRRDGCDVGFAAGVTSRRDGCDVGFAAGVTSRRDGCDVGFAAGVTSRSGTLAMQIAGPVCLATTGVMWALGIAFSRLWRGEWRRRQQAMELRARVQLHALAMDLLKKPILSPRILQDPVLRRQLLVKLRQQSAMDVGSVESGSSRRSSRIIGGYGDYQPVIGSVSASAASSAAAARRHRDSVISAILRQEIERRKSLKDIADGTNAEKLTPAAALAAAAAAFELPGIHISRIETMDLEDDEQLGSRRGCFGDGLGSRRFIIIESDLSSGDFSQLSFTSEYSLNGYGSRSSRSRSSRASSNVSSRLWDFSPRESEWDADVSHGSRESQLSSTVVSKADWGGGPSYGGCSRGAAGAAGSRGRDYSLLPPAMPRKGSVVTFDVGEPGVRRHSSPVPPSRRRSSVAVIPGSNGGIATTSSADNEHAPVSAMKYKDIVSGPSPSFAGLYAFGGMSTTSNGGGGQLRCFEDSRTLTQFRKRSAGDQSIISIRIDEDDSGEELEERRLGVEGEQLAGRGSTGRHDDDDEIDIRLSDDEEEEDNATADEITPLNIRLSSSDENRKSCTSDEEDSRSRAPPIIKNTRAGGELEQTSNMSAAELLLKRRRSSMKRNNTDDSEVARRVERIFDEIDYSLSESVDESKLLTSHSSAEASSNMPGGGSIDDSGADTAYGGCVGDGDVLSALTTAQVQGHQLRFEPSSIKREKSLTAYTSTTSSNMAIDFNRKSEIDSPVSEFCGSEFNQLPVMPSPGNRKFRLLTSIPRAILSLERRAFGLHSRLSPTSKDDEKKTPAEAAESPTAHSKSNRLLVSLGLCDDSD